MIIEKIEQLPLNSFITKPDGTIISANRQLPEAIISKLDYKRKVTELFDRWEEPYPSIVLAAKHGKWYVLYLHELENNHFLYIVTDGTWLYELRNRVRELDKSNRELDAIIESSYDGIYITDQHGNTLKTNSAIERITGIPKHYYIGKNVSDLIKRGILHESVTSKVIDKKKTVTVVQKNLNGKETLMTGSPVFNERGEVEKVVTNIRDLSELNQLMEKLKKARQLNEKYKEELMRLKDTSVTSSDIVIKSEKMLEIYNMAGRVANFDTTILILGETGVGKDVLVRNIFKKSSRSKKGQLIKVNCGAIPKDLLESELFGYEGGAFSGANRAGKAGMFELADKGVLFLDEVSELPLNLQVKLLRAIQEREIMRVGGTKLKKVDIQFIAASNKDLAEMVKKGEFREDLYYRLNVVPLHIPPLRERKDDILPLVRHYLEKYNEKYKTEKDFDRELKNFFYYYEWPGNVRELSNLIERLILTVPHQLLTIEDLPDEYKKHREQDPVENHQEMSLKEAVERAEKRLLQQAIKKYRTTYEIAEKLKTSQPTIVRKLQKYNLTVEGK